MRSADVLDNSKAIKSVDWMIAAAVFLAAMAVRLIFLFTSPDRGWPHSIWYEGDAITWVEWTRAIHTGAMFEFNLPLRTPAVAYFLSWFGGDLTGPFIGFKVVWCGFTSAACSLAYLSCTICFKRRIALIATGLCVFSFGLDLLSTSLNNEAPYLMILMAIVLATLLFIQTPIYWRAMLIGALHGIAMLIRFEHELLFAVLLLFAAASLWRTRSKRVGVAGRTNSFHPPHAALNVRRIGGVIATMIAIALLIVLPWSIHGSRATQRFNTTTTEPPDFAACALNWHPDAREFIATLPAFAQYGVVKSVDFIGARTGRRDITRQDVIDIQQKYFGYLQEPLQNWTWLSLKGPLDFALANYPAGDGGFSLAALQAPGEIGPAKLAFGRPDHLKLINHGYRAGWGYITSDFGGWLNRVATKLTRFADGFSLGFTGMNLPSGLHGVRPAVDLFINASNQPSAVHVIWRSTMLAFFALGLVIAMIRRQGGIWFIVILYKVLISIFFYGYARQAVSILPAFYVFMALAIDQALVWCRIERWRSRISSRGMTLATTSALVLLLAIELYAGLKRPKLSISGNLTPTSQWGDASFECVERLEISPQTNSASN